MRHLLVAIIAFVVCAGHAYAQDKDYFRSSQARSLEPTQEVFIRPKVARLMMITDTTKYANGTIKVDTLRKKTEPFTFEQEQYDWRVLTFDVLQDLKATALYMATEKFDADVILGATFDVRNIKEKGKKGVEIIVKGYPAKYVDWEDASDKDYVWINNIYGIKSRSDAEANNTKAVKR